jgi:hypothetical protein
MKGRNEANAYPDDVGALVAAACRENRPIELPAEALAKLGHHKRNPLKAVRAFCLDCMGGNRAEVRRCTSVGCSLWVYRSGKNPFTARKGPVTP